MITFNRLVFFITTMILIGCDGKEEKKESQITIGKKTKTETQVQKPTSKKVPASQRITLENKGVGKIKSIKLDPKINQEMVKRGALLFKNNCTACHKINRRFIGSSVKGIMNKRSPEWVMNMILDPQLMVKQDQTAKDLLAEFNGARMVNQGLTEDQVRDILEYFRTLH
ncbi:cytochrome c [Aquimarina sp. I32.4]|uniref:c-type cytochrome n=1 Tax=Aquimarina sp. I32.4 TaxID=2053903 RepID=UPI000CDF276C|nr:cytochrome c [Aquimarina sp. I32.4]